MTTTSDEPAAGGTADAATRLAECLRDYYAAWLRYHPVEAVDAGEYAYADRLAPVGDDDIGALMSLQRELLASLDEMQGESLDGDHRLDCHLAYGSALLQLDELSQHDWRLRDPQRFLPAYAIYQLTVRPVPDAADAMAARLAAVPGHLRQARQQLQGDPALVPPLWLDSALTATRASITYLRGLDGHPLVDEAPRNAALRRALDAAVVALQGYGLFLERDLAPLTGDGAVACGEERYRLLLAHRHFLPVEPAELREFGEELAARTAAELDEVCRELGGDTDARRVHAQIAADCPDRERLLETYDDTMAAARRFVSRHGLVSLPAAEQLSVVATPPFLRHQVPFAAYVPPVPTDPAQQGLFYVTVPEDAGGRGEHDRAGIRHTCVHEAWPGHHLQFVTANLGAASRSLPRLLNTSATLYEGWALYCEQLMHEQGFMRGPEHRFLLLRDRLWRALRVVIDVDLHVHGREPAELMSVLRERLGFTEPQARGEITWYSRAPATPMGYAVGWAVISEARDLLAAARSFELQEFHDRLLGAGSVAVSMALARGFGDELARAAIDGVLARTPARTGSAN